MLQLALYSPENGSGANWSNPNTGEIALVLTQKNTTDDYDQQINNLQNNIKNSQKIIVEYTPLRWEYQIQYNQKMEQVRNLSKEYEEIKRNHMSDEEKTIFEENKKAEAEMWQHIFDGMWFGGPWARWNFASEEEFFQYQQAESKKRADENYVKKNMEEVKWELVDQIRDLDLKTIYRKISLLLHPDRLSKNNDVMSHDDYHQYLKSVYQKAKDFNDKEDKAALISLIQEAGIRYVDKKFVLWSYEEFLKGSANIHKKNIVQWLEEQLSFLKQSYVYVFYVKHTTGETKKELRQLDDRIQELEDLIASYSTTSQNE